MSQGEFAITISIIGMGSVKRDGQTKDPYVVIETFVSPICWLALCLYLNKINLFECNWNATSPTFLKFIQWENFLLSLDKSLGNPMTYLGHS